MDFDGDGTLDLVSGSYDPGELYLFRGVGKGEFEPREVIRDRNGKPILTAPDQKEPVESFGSWLTLVDWDDDGDLDIVAGTFEGLMYLRRNEGTRAEPEYGTKNEWIMVGSKRLCVPGGEHANPVIADWDGDGRWDIITGSGDGGVYCYRNIGKRGVPEFAAPTALVPKHEGVGGSELLDADNEPRPGIRSQIAVVDYDGDGKLDVLLGDFCTYLHVRKDLTPGERREFDTTRGRREKVNEALRDGMDALRARFREAVKGVPKSDWSTPENSAKWQKMYEEMRESPEYKERLTESEQLGKDLQKYLNTEGAQHGPAVPRGYVWLFRRK